MKEVFKQLLIKWLKLNQTIEVSNQTPGRFYIVNIYSEIIPVPYKTWQDASAVCEPGEFVYLADSADFLEYSLFFAKDNEVILEGKGL